MSRVRLAHPPVLGVLLLVLFSAIPATAATDAELSAARSLDAAKAARDAKDWPEAARLYRALCDDNPLQGRFWYWLGAAHYAMKQWEPSADAYAHSAELGFEKGVSLYNRGCCLSMLGRTEEAVAALEGAIRAGLQGRDDLLRTDSDLDAVRGTEIFKARILPPAPPASDRAAGWRTDLDYLDRRVRETHWDPFRNIPEADWAREVAAIRKDAARLDDSQVTVRLMQLIARLGDGHSSVWPKTDGSWHQIPAELYLFSDGLFVRAAAPEYKDALGGRILRIGNLPVDEALARAETVCPRDNEMTVRWITPQLLTLVEVLGGLGIQRAADGADVELEMPDGARRTVHFGSIPLRHMHGTPAGFVSMADDAASPVPLWRKHPDDRYWFERVAADDLVYFQFNQVLDADHGPSLAEFTKTLFDSLAAGPSDALVIDVRRNNGGNNFLLTPLLDALRAAPQFDTRGRLFVIIGRNTFSACQNFVNRLDRDVHPIFVGEPTGSRPNFVGEDNEILLPWSGLRVSASSRYWQDSLSEDARMFVAPDLPAVMSSADYRANRDPAMEVIREYLAVRRAPAASTGANR